MRTYLECIPCFFKQALNVSNIAGIDDETQKKILDDICGAIPSISMDATPPEIAVQIYGIFSKRTGIDDPYKKLKEKCNTVALSLYPELKQLVAEADNTLLAAVECAIAGNIIDYGAVENLQVREELRAILERETDSIRQESEEFFNFSAFVHSLEQANRLLYIGDNAGEIVFDRVLLETIKEVTSIEEVFFAVRDKPIINDVTEKDAYETGMDHIAEIVSSGSEAPGTILSRCSPRFQSLFSNADIVISKGQGNYESMSGSIERADVFFLLRAKCEVIAKHLGCRVGDIILHV